jgi:hypothetical protein
MSIPYLGGYDENKEKLRRTWNFESWGGGCESVERCGFGAPSRTQKLEHMATYKFHLTRAPILY